MLLLLFFFFILLLVLIFKINDNNIHFFPHFRLTKCNKNEAVLKNTVWVQSVPRRAVDVRQCNKRKRNKEFLF